MSIKAWEMSLDDVVKLRKVLHKMQVLSMIDLPFRNAPIVGLYLHAVRYFYS